MGMRVAVKAVTVHPNHAALLRKRGVILPNQGNPCGNQTGYPPVILKLDYKVSSSGKFNRLSGFVSAGTVKS